MKINYKKSSNNSLSPFIILGDFNCHSTLWGCKNTNQKGKNLETFINNNLCIYSNKSPTYLCLFSGSYSAIGLSLGDPSIFIDFSWKVMKDTYGIDHLPAHEAPLQLRSEKLSLQYCIKLKSCPSNPAYDCIFQSKYKQQFEQKERTIKQFGLRMEPILKESTISLANVHKSIITQTPPWIIKKTKVILQLSEHTKTKTHPSTYIEKFHTILLHHPGHQYRFTDGSKDNNKTACAAVLQKRKKIQKRPS